MSEEQSVPREIALAQTINAADKQADPTGFANAIATMIFEDACCDLDALEVAELLQAHGIIKYRKPTGKDLADPEWWGHDWDMKANDDGVGELTPSFKVLTKCSP